MVFVNAATQESHKIVEAFESEKCEIEIGVSELVSALKAGPPC